MAGSSWEVENQVPTVGLGPTGKPVEGWQVNYKTSSGVHGHVFIPLAQYNANTVKAKIQEMVTHNDAVANLKG
jgi:hypothetical protein